MVGVKWYALTLRNTPNGDAMKALRRLPILVERSLGDYGQVIPWMAQWKWDWLSHWRSLEFRGRISAADYARLHGVSRQAVAWLIRTGRLGSVRDTSGGHWVREDWPYPATVYRVGGHARAGQPDATVRALGHADFVIAGYGPCPSDAHLEHYCNKMCVHPRKTLDHAIKIAQEDLRNKEAEFLADPVLHRNM